jgi:hypothetical protein
MKHRDTTTDEALSIPLFYPDGNVRTVLQFANLGIGEPLTAALRSGFIALYAHTASSSQIQLFFHVRRFAKFICSMGGGKEPLPPDILAQFRSWLAKNGLKPSGITSNLNKVVSLLEYCERNSPHLLSKAMRFNFEPFEVDVAETYPIKDRNNLSEDDVKSILRCCYQDIENTERRLEVGKRLRDGTANGEDGFDEKTLSIIRDLLVLGNGFLPTMNVILAAKKCLKRRVVEAGGVEKISRLLYPCCEDMLPFYLAVLIQTSGNPWSISAMTRDCIKPHPLRDDLERVAWKKPRARKEQWVDMPIGRSWSAANIVRRLCFLNECILPRCIARDQDKVFLAFRCTCGPLRQISASGLHLMKRQFEKRHDLTSFSFVAIRRAGARAHHGASGSIRGAQVRLNHASLETTARYVDMEEMADAHDRLIHRYQGLLIATSLQGEKTSLRGSEPPHVTERHAETVFGFECRDPFAGVAEGSARGALCMQFQKCATCPGAVILLDDIQIVARLLSASAALEDARERALQEGWMERFVKLYEPTRQILAIQILPGVTEAIRKRAAASVDIRRIPRLE